VWDGVFTTAQAERGRIAYETSCVNCHNKDLAGSVRAPALRGDKFMLSWQNGSVNNLYSKIRFSMPATYPETVSDDVKLDIVTYLLQANGFPTGSAELKMEADRLEAIQIVKKGNTELPNFVLVQAVGCLTKVNKGWNLTDASEPIGTKEDSPMSASKLGTQTFLLVSAAAFQPESHAGETIAVKGLLYREPGESRLNLTSLQTISPGCSSSATAGAEGALRGLQ
jgi:hypothetical protein